MVSIHSNYSTRPINHQSYSNAHNRTQSSLEAHDKQLIEESYIMDHLLAQSNLFEALQLAHQINILNGYQVVSQYDFTQIKTYFRQKEIQKIRIEKSIKQNPDNLNSKKQFSKNQNQKNKMSNFKKEYQKAYMKLNTNQKGGSQYDTTI